MDFIVSKPSKLDGAVRITVPASVAFNADLFKSNLSQLVEQLGCPKCHSGFDFRFSLAQKYFINEKLELKVSNAYLHESDPEGAPASKVFPAVEIGLSSKHSNKLDSVLRVFEVLRKNFGCAPCHSGLDISFKTEIDRFRTGVFN